MPRLALTLNSTRVTRPWKNLHVESAWIGNCHSYHVALFLLILKILEMRHNHVFVLRIFKILKKCHFWPSLETPGTFLGRRKIFRFKVCRLERFLEMRHSHIFLLSYKLLTGVNFGPRSDFFSCFSRLEKMFRWKVRVLEFISPII